MWGYGYTTVIAISSYFFHEWPPNRVCCGDVDMQQLSPFLLIHEWLPNRVCFGDVDTQQLLSFLLIHEWPLNRMCLEMLIHNSYCRVFWFMNERPIVCVWRCRYPTVIDVSSCPGMNAQSYMFGGVDTQQLLTFILVHEWPPNRMCLEVLIHNSYCRFILIHEKPPNRICCERVDTQH